MKDSEICYAAAGYISEHGHTKGVLWNSEGAVCLLGALIRAQGAVNLLVTLEHEATARRIGKQMQARLLAQSDIFPGTNAIVDWNNAEERSAEEVILELKRQGEIFEAAGA